MLDTCGRATADKYGLITLEKVRVTKAGNRIRVSDPDELSDAVRGSPAGDVPQLIEVAARHPQQ